jgi:hypothetical protein
VGQHGLGSLSADEPRRRVEVVVVEEDRRVRLALELVEHGLGEVPVDGDVPLLPRVVERLVDLGRRGQAPQVVLHEPQDGVGDDVVVPVVRSRVVGDEPQPIRRAVLCHLVQCPVLRFLGGSAVLLGHRARDPRHLMPRDESAERGHEPPAAAPGDAKPVLAAGEGDGTAVGNDDQLPPGHGAHPTGVARAKPRRW